MKNKHILSKKTIEDEISNYKIQLEQLQSIGIGDLKPEIVSLRNNVLFTHSTIEYLLHSLIIEDFAPNNSIYSRALMMLKLIPFLNGLDYLPLLRACKERGFFAKGEFETLSAVNTHRRSFAHPNAYSKKIKNYDDRLNYLTTLKELSKALSTTFTILGRYRESRKKQGSSLSKIHAKTK